MTVANLAVVFSVLKIHGDAGEAAPPAPAEDTHDGFEANGGVAEHLDGMSAHPRVRR